MTKLTMNTQGGYAPQQQAFAPPPQRAGLSGWVIAAGAFVFLALFAGLIVTSTLLFVQSNQNIAAAANTGLTEPTFPGATDAVTRTNVNLLQSEQATTPPATTAVIAAVAPAPTPVPQPTEAPVQVASTVNTVPLRLGRFHRYRVPSCVDYLDTMVGITTVNFPVGGDQPDPADMIRVRNIATAVEMCDEVKVIVEGHSDRRGSEKINMDLSWFRAQSVIDQLQSEGYDVTAMEPKGFGAKRPINLSGTISGEAVNRRVQFALAPRAAPPAGLVQDN
ncbi:OmpA family protein [uncultured Tateyamaria sp.]|uniref:OmpA family protein n=1 Tax=uncultured Tateyamaria sp. TaxID=455651 RepID=UPI002624F9C9|nr:OmpA family protein [uncultured Tateyamaria sp.]